MRRNQSSVIKSLKADISVEQYALTEAAYLLARILQEYDEIDGSAIATEPSRAFALTNFPRDGVKLRLRKAT